MARRHDHAELPVGSTPEHETAATPPSEGTEADYQTAGANVAADAPSPGIDAARAASATAATPEPKRNTALTASEAVRLMLATLKRVPLDKQAKVLSSLAVLAELDQ